MMQLPKWVPLQIATKSLFPALYLPTLIPHIQLQGSALHQFIPPQVGVGSISCCLLSVQALASFDSKCFRASQLAPLKWSVHSILDEW